MVQVRRIKFDEHLSWNKEAEGDEETEERPVIGIASGIIWLIGMTITIALLLEYVVGTIGICIILRMSSLLSTTCILTLTLLRLNKIYLWGFLWGLLHKFLCLWLVLLYHLPVTISVINLLIDTFIK